MFSILPETDFSYSVTLNFLSANAFNLDQSKNLSFGKELKTKFITVIYPLQSLSISSTINRLTFPIRQILGSSKLKEFADDNFKFYKNGRKFSKWVEKTRGKKEKVLITSDFSFSLCVFQSLVLQTRKNQGLFGKGLRYCRKSILTIFIQFSHSCDSGWHFLEYQACKLYDVYTKIM